MLDAHCDRMCAAEHAPRGPFGLLERRHGLAEVLECGAFVIVERRRVIPPQPDREFMIFAENASRHRYRFSHQGLGLFEAPETNKGSRVVVGC
jgi:hypothetical protein